MHLNTFFFEKGSVGLASLPKGSMAQRKLRTPALAYKVPESKPWGAHVVTSTHGLSHKGVRFVLKRNIIVCMIISFLFSVEMGRVLTTRKSVSFTIWTLLHGVRTEGSDVTRSQQ